MKCQGYVLQGRFRECFLVSRAGLGRTRETVEQCPSAMAKEALQARQITEAGANQLTGVQGLYTPWGCACR